jgi:hypothetical protein
MHQPYVHKNDIVHLFCILSSAKDILHITDLIIKLYVFKLFYASYFP